MEARVKQAARPVRVPPGTDPWTILEKESAETAPGELLAVTLDGFPVSQGATIARLTGFEVREVQGRALVLQRVHQEIRPMSCSVVVPCLNEAGNVAELVRRTPAIGTGTEIIFVDGGSTDGTVERITQLIAEHPDRDITLLQQRAAGGKAAAVFQGFDAALGDVVMILDADMTVAPEDLPRFHRAIALGLAGFANGTRFAYSMEPGAMPLLNHLGNRVFALTLSGVTGRRLTDTLCGTKALRKSDWERLSAIRSNFGGTDRWGDFDLLLGATALGLSVVDVPVPYGARVAGDSKMQPFRHLPALGRTCLAGWRYLHGRRPAL